jgi:hypothetical protein
MTRDKTTRKEILTGQTPHNHLYQMRTITNKLYPGAGVIIHGNKIASLE